MAETKKKAARRVVTFGQGPSGAQAGPVAGPAPPEGDPTARAAAMARLEERIDAVMFDAVSLGGLEDVERHVRAARRSLILLGGPGR